MQCGPPRRSRWLLPHARGSVQDREAIEACDEAGIAMAFTDERCFRHFKA